MRRKTIILLLVPLLLIFGDAAWANFTEPTIISSPDQVTYQFNFSPDIIEGKDGRLHAFWASNRYRDPEPTYMLYSYSDDGGKTWSTLKRVDERYDFWRLFEGPKGVIDEQGILHLSFHYINWLVRISNSKYARSVDNGDTWSAVYSPIWGGYNRNGNIALDPLGSVFIARDRWTSYGSFPNEVYLRNSTDGGLTWPDYWSVSSPAMLISNRRAEAQSFLIDATGLQHLLLNVPGASNNASANIYLVSTDSGFNWQERSNIPQGFVMGGIYGYGNELLMPGSHNGNTAFIRSMDNGLTWEGPFAVAGTGHLNQIVSDGNNNYHTFYLDAYYYSNDKGMTWSGPDYMGSGTISKLLLTKSGDLLAIGTFGTHIGLIKHEPSDEVRAPEYLSVWEKSSFIYSFDIRGNGEVQISLPAEYVKVDVEPLVALGDLQVLATSEIVNDRAIVSFPVSSMEWISAALAIMVKKGYMKYARSIQARIKSLEAELEDAAIQEDGERADQIDQELHELDNELFSVQQEFIVSLQGASKMVFDRTDVSIYEHLTSVYSHFKANPKNQAVELLLLTDDTISIAKGEPFMLEVKVTNLNEGQVASSSIAGNYVMLDVIKTNSTGKRKTEFYLFYPPDIETTTETITISVTVADVTASVPIQVNIL